MNKNKKTYSTDDIAKLAYFIWVNEGKPQGQHLRHWQEAETMLKEVNTSKTQQTDLPLPAQKRVSATKQTRKAVKGNGSRV